MNLFLSADDMDTFHRQYSDDNSAPESIIGIFEPYDSIINVLPLTPLPPNKLAICGSLNSIQTIKGIEHFRNNCLTALANIYKDNYMLRIAGRNPGKLIYDLFKNNNNIKIIPNPVEMSNVIKDCGIFICPTNVGGGIKLRILDGLKLGMPILTHEVSARGYNALHQYNWFQMYHDEESFAKGLSHIIKTIDTNIHLRKEILEVYNNLFSATHGDTKFLKAMKVFLDS